MQPLKRFAGCALPSCFTAVQRIGSIRQARTVFSAGLIYSRAFRLIVSGLFFIHRRGEVAEWSKARPC
jgi:hypothetical protein